MSTNQPLHLAGVERLYLDNNVWDLIASHPESNQIATLLANPNKRLALISMITAVETLRAPEATRQTNTLLMRPALLASNHVIPHPTRVLTIGVASRRRELPYLELEEDDSAKALKAMLLGQVPIDTDDLNAMAAWIDDHKRSFRNFVQAVRSKVARNHTMRVKETWLDDKGLRRMLVGYVPEVTLNRREVRLLFDSIPAWAALGYQVGLSIEIANRPGNPGGMGPDMLQIPYLGLVTEFVTNDGDFLEAATRACQLLGERPGHIVKTTRAKDFFLNLGFPHPLL